MDKPRKDNSPAMRRANATIRSLQLALKHNHMPTNTAPYEFTCEHCQTTLTINGQGAVVGVMVTTNCIR